MIILQYNKLIRYKSIGESPMGYDIVSIPDRFTLDQRNLIAWYFNTLIKPLRACYLATLIFISIHVCQSELEIEINYFLLNPPQYGLLWLIHNLRGLERIEGDFDSRGKILIMTCLDTLVFTSIQVLFGCPCIHINPHVLRWIGVEISVVSTPVHLST